MISEARLKVLINSINKQIPKRLTDYYKDENHRRIIAAKFNAERAFLDSSNFKFILINPHTGQYDCNLCFLAIMKALWNSHRNTKLPTSYYTNMLKKGKTLFKSIGCRDKLTIKLPDAFDFNDLD
jgi:hypothetical protein